MKASKTCRKLLNDYGGATRVEMFWIYKDAATVVCEHQVRQKNVFGTHVKWEEVIRAGSWNLLRWNSFFEFFTSCVLTNECTYFTFLEDCLNLRFKFVVGFFVFTTQ